MTKILIIDDDDSIRRLIVRIVEGAGHEAIEAKDGEEGVRQFEAHKPPLVITDILMPGKEGIQTMREIHAAAPQTKIIAISGGGPRQDMIYLKFSEQLGANAVLTKPFQPNDLRKLIEDLLAQNEPQFNRAVPLNDNSI